MCTAQWIHMPFEVFKIHDTLEKKNAFWMLCINVKFNKSKRTYIYSGYKSQTDRKYYNQILQGISEYVSLGSKYFSREIF